MNARNVVTKRHEQDIIDVGNKIAALRNTENISQEMMAAQIETTQRIVSFHETGKCEMSIGTFFQYANALGVDPQKLFPDRFCHKEMQNKVDRLNVILSQLSEKSLDTIIGLAEQMSYLENQNMPNLI